MRNGRRRGAGAGAASPSATGRYLAETAYLEAASVDAFRRLARELEWHGAPERLRAASLRAARDEVRHAQVTRSLAEAAGGRVPRVEKKSYRVRRLEAVALENAIEGCVRETFGAATALVQAATARDPKVRDAMRRIAEDEVRHAELAWAVAGWLDLRLSSPARARVAQARRRAGAAAVRAASVDPSPTLIEELGVPSGRRARAIAIALHQALWA